MSVNTDYEGRVYPPSPPFQVGREAIRDFAEAVGASSVLHRDLLAARAAGHADLVAPPTFTVAVAQRCEAQFVQDPEAGIDFSRVVHAEEQFHLERPVVAGDDITAVLTVERIRGVGGNVLVTTRVDMWSEPTCQDKVGTVRSTLLVRGEDR
ncbi:hypothetical protein KEM60_01909 [Austwickia sp. TVS 96-490-7B]|uniref:FAS1-like dehydratase domain-containing protein n=1 Tax=Austwickia sp. TVS 96-490-7B TaxID=2830843 RepID=UPI001C57964B|nr:MaoC family dehydratase N-terminal domain-containing protein [Austwickia sp. TVS 96-490-7B]MBW3085702.1 hypothetical protein [Austwickia sp. TVS 96-490-7B]